MVLFFWGLRDWANRKGGEVWESAMILLTICAIKMKMHKYAGDV